MCSAAPQRKKPLFLHGNQPLPDSVCFPAVDLPKHKQKWKLLITRKHLLLARLDQYKTISLPVCEYALHSSYTLLFGNSWLVTGWFALPFMVVAQSNARYNRFPRYFI